MEKITFRFLDIASSVLPDLLETEQKRLEEEKKQTLILERIAKVLEDRHE